MPARNNSIHRWEPKTSQNKSQYSDQMKKFSYLGNSISNDKPGFFPHTKKIITQEHSMFFLISRQKIKKLLVEIKKKKKFFYAVIINCVFNLKLLIFLNTSEAKESSQIFATDLYFLLGMFQHTGQRVNAVKIHDADLRFYNKNQGLCLLSYSEFCRKVLRWQKHHLRLT